MNSEVTLETCIDPARIIAGLENTLLSTKEVSAVIEDENPHEYNGTAFKVTPRVPAIESIGPGS